jgi:hypothetical protein
MHRSARQSADAMKPRHRWIPIARPGVLPLVAIIPAGAAACVLVVRGALTLDLGLGRRVRPLGPIRVEVAAPPEVLFERSLHDTCAEAERRARRPSP